MDTTQVKQRMQKALDHFEEELKKVRTGRAHASTLDSIQVEVYGQMTPLAHAANVITVDAQLLQITPFDPSNLAAISAAIRNDSSLGLNPADDGKVVRVPIPAMTEERRLEVVKQLGEKAEECRISLRNARHDALKDAKQQEKDKSISQDDYKNIEKRLNDLIDDFNKKLDALTKAKEQEVMTV